MRLRATLLSLVALGSIGCANRQATREELHDDPGGLLFNGFSKSDVQCYKCHSGDARGRFRGKNLSDYVPTMTDAEIKDAIRNGQGRMPAFKDRLSSEEIDQIVHWLRGQLGTAAPKAG